MCETSKTPADSRTARCSALTDSYWTGISQPAKGTSRAPAATWRSWSGVRRRAVCGAAGIGAEQRISGLACAPADLVGLGGPAAHGFMEGSHVATPALRRRAVLRAARPGIGVRHGGRHPGERPPHARLVRLRRRAG